MHPIFSHRSTVLVYFSASAVLGLICALVLVAMHLEAPTGALLLCLPAALLLAQLCGATFFVCKALPYSHRSLLHNLLARTVACVGLAVLWLLALLGWAALNSAQLPALLPLLLRQESGVQLAVLASGMLLLSCLAYDIAAALTEVRHAEQREQRAALLAKEAELQVLRTQIDPHFLFNSLNSISALTAFDPAGARDMTLALAQFFRQTLALSARQTIRLEEEIDLCEHFLAVEKVRYGERLQVQWHIDPDCRPYTLLPLALQPLLENALKHGVRHVRGAACIAIHIGQNATHWHIAVQNPCPAMPVPSSGNGLGLINLKQRLAMQFEDRAHLAWERSDTDFTVTLTLPLDPLSHSAHTP